jgi:hypothetical protein
VIKESIRNTFVYEIFKKSRQKRQLKRWERIGRPVPPPHLYKQEQLKEYARRFFLTTLVETGTYSGDMVYATKDTFREIFSVELDKVMFEMAKKRFARFDHISILHGDSAEVLPRIISNLTQPCLFWLDAHYSGGITAKGELETPILQEIRCILDNCKVEYVVLIDDARELVGKNNYPTLDELRRLVSEKNRDWGFQIRDDIIRIHKRIN